MLQPTEVPPRPHVLSKTKQTSQFHRGDHLQRRNATTRYDPFGHGRDSLGTARSTARALPQLCRRLAPSGHWRGTSSALARREPRPTVRPGGRRGGGSRRGRRGRPTAWSRPSSATLPAPHLSARLAGPGWRGRLRLTLLRAGLALCRPLSGRGRPVTGGEGGARRTRQAEARAGKQREQAALRTRCHPMAKPRPAIR